MGGFGREPREQILSCCITPRMENDLRVMTVAVETRPASMDRATRLMDRGKKRHRGCMVRVATSWFHGEKDTCLQKCCFEICTEACTVHFPNAVSCPIVISGKDGSRCPLVCQFL